MADVSGFTFPFRIDSATGGVSGATGRDKIRQNIRAILSTRYGERVMLREYGTRLHSLVHDPNDEALAVLARKQVQEALMAWEPRILVTNITVERHEGELHMRLDYAYTNEPVTDSLLVPLG